MNKRKRSYRKKKISKGKKSFSNTGQYVNVSIQGQRRPQSFRGSGGHSGYIGGLSTVHVAQPPQIIFNSEQRDYPWQNIATQVGNDILERLMRNNNQELGAEIMNSNSAVREEISRLNSMNRHRESAFESSLGSNTPTPNKQRAYELRPSAAREDQQESRPSAVKKEGRVRTPAGSSQPAPPFHAGGAVAGLFEDIYRAEEVRAHENLMNNSIVGKRHRQPVDRFRPGG